MTQARIQQNSLVNLADNLTYKAEGMDYGRYDSRKLHVPSPNSGLNIGRGYDMKELPASKIVADLTHSGVDLDDAILLSQASGLRGETAKQFIHEHHLTKFKISTAVQEMLFRKIYAEIEADVKQICNKKDCIKEYGAVDWDNLNIKIKDVLVDLRYHGDYTPKSRKQIQKLVASNDLATFTDIVSTRDKWSHVPTRRFNRRVAFLRN